MKVTIISLDKWGYNKYIAKELHKQGIQAWHIDLYKFQYKYPTFFHKALNFITKNIFGFNFKRYHLNKVLLQVLSDQEKQDVILIIKGDELSIRTIKRLKENTDCLIAFFNDSIDRYPRMKKIYPCFDKVYSFDSKDVLNYDFSLIPNYIYFDPCQIEEKEEQYTVFNIGSLDKRSKVLPAFVSYFKANQIQYKLIAYAAKNEITCEQEGIEIIHEIYPLNTIFNTFITKSRILLDIQRPKQKGLSFRVFEAMGLGKKIITTNEDIVNYDFYNPTNILVVDVNDIYIPEDFLNTPYQEVSSDVLQKYHISSWVRKVFMLPESNIQEKL